MKYIIFIVVLIGALYLTSGTPYLKKAATASQVAAVGVIQPLFEQVDQLEKSAGTPFNLIAFDKAFDIREGGSARFDNLVMRFNKIEYPVDCEEHECRVANITLSDASDTDEVNIARGDTIEWGGYIIKLSQTAPLEKRGGVPSRIVLLIAEGA